MVAALLVSACSATGGASRTAASPPAARAPSRAAQAPTVTPAASRGPYDATCNFRSEPPRAYRHVIWIWFENTDEEEVVAASAGLPYTASLLQHCGLAGDYHNITHPSLPNYIAATSGIAEGAATLTDCPPSACPQPQRSLFDQVQAAGMQWREYAQSASGTCTDTPVAYYPSLAAQCARWDVPLGAPDASGLQADLDAGTAPAFAFVIPDGAHDMGAGADSFLQAWIPAITGSAAYRAGDTAVFVTWDEGGTARLPGEACDDALHSDVAAYPGCHVATIVISPTTGAARPSAYFTHLSLLRTTEEMLGIGEHLAGAAAAASMRLAFHL